MPEARLELAQGFNSPTDFKSGASADSATRALFFNCLRIGADSLPAGRQAPLGHFVSLQ